MLIEGWKAAHKLWSVRLLLVATLLDGIDAGFYVLGDVLPRGTFLALGIGLKFAILAARVTKQKGIKE